MRCRESERKEELSNYGTFAKNYYKYRNYAKEAAKFINKNYPELLQTFSFALLKGTKDGAFIPNLDYNGTNYFAIAVRTGFKDNPTVQFQFEPLSKRPPFDDEELRLELLDRLNEIPEVNLPRDSISRYPSIPIGTFQEESSFQKLIEVLEWTIQKIKS